MCPYNQNLAIDFITIKKNKIKSLDWGYGVDLDISDFYVIYWILIFTFKKCTLFDFSVSMLTF